MRGGKVGDFTEAKLCYFKVHWSRDVAWPTQCDTQDSLRENILFKDHMRSFTIGILTLKEKMLEGDTYMQMDCAWAWAEAYSTPLVLTTEKGPFSDQKQIPHQSTWFGKPPFNPLPAHLCYKELHMCRRWPEYEPRGAPWFLQKNGFVCMKKFY